MEPLAAKLRPQTLEQYVGQEHLVGENGPLRAAIAKKHLFSFILWGPPGTGKTTLARIYAKALNAQYHELSAVSAGKDDLRAVMEAGELFGPRVLFLDEIHRFNKAQQDFLLPHVERGALTLIGATTENPSFEVVPALLSRCRVFTLKSLSDDNLKELIARAGYGVKPDAEAWLLAQAGGDARQLLAMMENAAGLYGEITLEGLQKSLQEKRFRYDKNGEEHYDTASAFIKSMRASQPDAALYYLARMIEGGEDPKFIARRMVIFASEDVGLADPQALVIANEVFRAVESIGLPECGINLGHGVAYLARAPKNRSAYDAYQSALSEAKQSGNLPIPLAVRNAPTKLMKELGYGKNYKMYDAESYLPDEIKNRKFLNY